MADIKSTSGFFTEEPPQSITEQSSDMGIGTPESPKGVSAVPGATPKQIDMAGTPNQVQSSRTLEQKKRLGDDPKKATKAQEAAAEKAESLSRLGPVRTAVSGMLESKLSEVSNVEAQVTAKQDQLELLEDDDVIAAASAALVEYIRIANDPNITDEERAPLLEEAAIAFDIAAGGGALVGDYVNEADVTASEAAQSALGGDFTIGSLDLSSISGGLSNEEFISQLDADLGLEPPASVANMSLDELDEAIDLVEAKELNQVEQIRAQLANPNLPPQVRQQLLAQLSQLSAAGITGAEASIDRLDEQLASADIITIGGREMTIDEALSDEGISATIKQAIEDPKYLEDLKDIRGYEVLADWIETYKTDLEEIVGEMTSTSGDIIENQETASGFLTKFGDQSPEHQEIIAGLLGIELTGPDGRYTSADIAKMEAGADTPVYKFLSESGWSSMILDDPELLLDVQDILESDWASKVEPPIDVDDIIADMEELKLDKRQMELLGIEDYPKSADDYKDMIENMEAWDNLDNQLISEVTWKLVDNGKINWDDIKEINDNDPEIIEKILMDLDESRRASSTWEDEVENGLENNLRKNVLKYLFDDINFSYHDLNAAFQKSSGSEKAMLAAIFDTNEDGKIDDDELHDKGVSDRAKTALGLDSTNKQIIESDGKWSSENKLSNFKKNIVVSGDTFSNEITKPIDDYIKDKQGKAEDEVVKHETLAKGHLQSAYPGKKAEEIDPKKVKRAGGIYKKAKKTYDDTLKSIDDMSDDDIIEMIKAEGGLRNVQVGGITVTPSTSRAIAQKRAKLKSDAYAPYERRVNYANNELGIIMGDVTKINWGSMDNYFDEVGKVKAFSDDVKSYRDQSNSLADMSDDDLQALFDEFDL